MSDSFDPEAFLPYLLNRAAEAASQSFQRDYRARYGMLRTEWRVMFHLGAYGAMTARDLASRAGIHKTKISRAVAALGRKRFVTREVVASDRRAAMLELTPAGQAAYADLSRRAVDHDTRLVAKLDPADAAALRRVLRQVAGMEPGDGASDD